MSKIDKTQIVRSGCSLVGKISRHGFSHKRMWMSTYSTNNYVLRGNSSCHSDEETGWGLRRTATATSLQQGESARENDQLSLLVSRHLFLEDLSVSVCTQLVTYQGNLQTISCTYSIMFSKFAFIALKVIKNCEKVRWPGRYSSVKLGYNSFHGQQMTEKHCRPSVALPAEGKRALSCASQPFPGGNNKSRATKKNFILSLRSST